MFIGGGTLHCNENELQLLRITGSSQLCESHNKNSDPRKPDTEENTEYGSICLKYKNRHNESVLSEARLVVGLGVAVPVRDTGGCWVLTEFCFLIWVLAMQECSIWGHEAVSSSRAETTASAYLSPSAQDSPRHTLCSANRQVCLRTCLWKLMSSSLCYWH